MQATKMPWKKNSGMRCGTLTALCRRLKVGLDEILAEAARGRLSPLPIAANDLVDSPISHIATDRSQELDAALLELGKSAAALFVVRTSGSRLYFARGVTIALRRSQ